MTSKDPVLYIFSFLLHRLEASVDTYLLRGHSHENFELRHDCEFIVARGRKGLGATSCHRSRGIYIDWLVRNSGYRDTIGLNICAIM